MGKSFTKGDRDEKRGSRWYSQHEESGQGERPELPRRSSLVAKGVNMLRRQLTLSFLIATGLILVSSSLLVARPQYAQTSTNDNAITTAIEAKLFRDPALKTQDIRVSTQQGVVTLSGTVDTQDQRDAADRIASLQPGVVKVIDSMTVANAAPAAPPSAGSNAQYPAPSQQTDSPQYSGGYSAQQYQVPSTLLLPAGTTLSVRLTQGLSTNTNKQGDTFTATLEQPVVVDGWVVARYGQTVQGRVDMVKKGGRVKGVSQMGINLTELTLVNGQQMPIHSQLVDTSAGASKGRDAAAVGTTTGIGAMIGAIAGEGEGAGIGAAAGAAAGIAGVLLTRGRPTVLPPETLLNFRLESSVNISTAQGQPAFRPVTQQDYPQQQLRQRPERVVMTPPPYYYGPQVYGGYYGWPGYYPGYYWGYGYPYRRYWGPGYVGIYRFGGDRDWHGGRGYFRGDRGEHRDHGDRGGRR